MRWVTTWPHYQAILLHLENNNIFAVRTSWGRKAKTPHGPLVYRNSGLESLVQKPLNGRQVSSPYCLPSGIDCSPSCHFQIKNLTSTAHALALRDTLSHLEFSIEAGEDFERDVNGAGSTEALNGYF